MFSLLTLKCINFWTQLSNVDWLLINDKHCYWKRCPRLELRSNTSAICETRSEDGIRDDILQSNAWLMSSIVSNVWFVSTQLIIIQLLIDCKRNPIEIEGIFNYQSIYEVAIEQWCAQSGSVYICRSDQVKSRSCATVRSTARHCLTWIYDGSESSDHLLRLSFANWAPNK